MSFDLYTISLPASSSDRPTVRLIMANSLRHGTRVGLLNVAGTQLGLALIVAVAGIELTSVIELIRHWLDVLRRLCKRSTRPNAINNERQRSILVRMGSRAGHALERAQA
jgi:hypothetical protein